MKTFLTIIVLPLFLSACLVSPGTNTGNPGLGGDPNAGTDPGISIYYLAAKICTKINTCYRQSSVPNCYSQIMALNGYPSELGTAVATYNTMSEIADALADDTLETNYTNFQNCQQAIESLSCSDPLVQNAYSTATPTNYSTTNILLRTSSSCQQIY